MVGECYRVVGGCGQMEFMCGYVRGWLVGGGEKVVVSRWW